jgi:hypothetical protein
MPPKGVERMYRQVRSLDGSIVDITSTTMDITGRVNSFARAEVTGELHEVIGGQVPDGLREDGFNVLGVPADREYGLLGGSLVVGSGAPPDEGFISALTWAIWSSDGFGLFGHFYGVDDSFVLSTVAALGPTVDDDGIVLRPDKSVRFTETPDVAVADASFGVLSIKKLTRRVERRLPRWEGASVDGGQLYADVTATGSCALTLVSDSAAAFLITNVGLDADFCVQHAAGIKVGWN